MHCRRRRRRGRHDAVGWYARNWLRVVEMTGRGRTYVGHASVVERLVRLGLLLLGLVGHDGLAQGTILASWMELWTTRLKTEVVGEMLSFRGNRGLRKVGASPLFRQDTRRQSILCLSRHRKLLTRSHLRRQNRSLFSVCSFSGFDDGYGE